MVAGVWVLPLVESSGHEVDVVLDEGEGDLAYVEVGCDRAVRSGTGVTIRNRITVVPR